MKYEPKKGFLPALGLGVGGVVFKDGAAVTAVPGVPARNCWCKFAISCSSCSALSKVKVIRFVTLLIQNPFKNELDW